MYIKWTEKEEFPMYLCLGIIGFGIMIIMLQLYSGGISGNDFWWHIKVGEWICKNKEIPTADIFSWYGIKNGFSWTAHEWLSEVILYKTFKLFGEKGIYFFSLIMALGMVTMAFLCTKDYIKENIYIGTFFIGMFAVVSKGAFYGRPHIFSFYLLFAELKILYDFYANPQKKGIFLLPVIGCLWSNLHGGSSSLAYILPAMFLFASLCEINFGRLYSKRLEKKEIWLLFVITLMTIGSLMINPIGLQIIVYPYINMGDSLMLSIISEWQAPDAKEWGCLILYFIPIVIMTIGVVCSEQKVRFIDMIIMLFFLFLFFRSVRFIILWYIAACFYSFRYVPKYKMKSIITRTEKILIVFLLLLLLVPLGKAVKKIINLGNTEPYISFTMSDEAIKAVVETKPEKIFNDYNLGEALIYNDVKVFFDSRADVYAQENILADGISLLLLAQMDSSTGNQYVDVDFLLKKYDFDSILIQKDRPLYTYMKSHSEEFECIYEDDKICYYRVK